MKTGFEITDAKRIDVRDGIVNNVIQAPKAVYFTVGALSARLSYHGIHGWRLQTNVQGKYDFDDNGASQTLARFLKEEIADLSEEISVVYEADAMTLRGGDGTSVTIATDRFSIAFCTADGKEISHLTDISFDGANVTVKGSLIENEAIFGGGERFDVVNKRGTAFPLDICDGWNCTHTSYMAIPLFITSRGGGMFINRYECMNVDFGAAVSDEWSVTVLNDVLDCYFYANGDIKAPYVGYTELSGHADLPEEWAQGVIICRYAPDMRTFEDMPAYRTPHTIEQVIEAPIPKNADSVCKHLWIARKTKATGEITYVPVGIYEDDEEYEYLYDIVYLTRGEGKYYRAAYYRAEDGYYYRLGPKYSPGGPGVKNLTEKFINADMKPTAMLMEAYDWGNMSRDIEFCRGSEADFKKCVNFLHERGLKAMIYMGLGGGISGCSAGLKDEYWVRANLTFADGTVEENTNALPQTQGGVNPDLGNSGRRGYIDITNPEAMDWYFNTIWNQVIDIGADGVKIDFCEFVPDEITYPDGTKVEYLWHDPSVFGKRDPHHGFPSYFLSMFYKKINEMKKEKGIPGGFMVLSRGGGIGVQRAPYMWAGDQTRTFEKIEDQYLAVVNSGLSGVPFMTYDMAGYQYQEHDGYFRMGEEEGRLFARAVECTAFTTNIQTHGDVRQAFEMSEDTQEIYRIYTKLHMKLMPFIQKYSKVACDTGVPVVRHMVLEHPTDVNVYNIENQFYFGDGLLVAPIFADHTYERDVYLPEGNWIELLTGKEIVGGKTVCAKANIGQIALYLDTSSEDFKALKEIFDGAEWNAAKAWN
ncbi:MAG: glycoside hydrolase family 31 protein [Clostridia bacterium]|nr:glycoside hydrolase family 31 protein [Clostridia bacterium]